MTSDSRGRPFQEFILKVHSRCNLACDYCYVYTMADQSWRDQPREMSPSVARQTAHRIAEHLDTRRITEAAVTLHGGEPLLLGPHRLDEIITGIRAAAGSRIRLRFALQTNGVLLDQPFLDLFARHGVRVGVSIDGAQAATDRHRRGPDGRGSHDLAGKAIDLLRQPRYSGSYAGLLCVIDPRNDPLDTYHALARHAPPVIDFLLPLGNWSATPPDRTEDQSQTPYADWLVAVFDRWYGAPRRTSIRLFDEIINLLLGGASRVESIGRSPTAAVVIETDGSIELADTLKSAYQGAGATGASVVRHSFDSVIAIPAVRALRQAASRLPTACGRCAVRDVCGGGLYAHRFRSGAGFDNPSVYCADLRRLILHIRQRVAKDLEDAVRGGPGEGR